MIDDFDAEITKLLDPFRRAQELLVTIPGFSEVTARVLVGEIDVYHVLQHAEPYRELGAQHFDQADTDRTLRKLTRRIEGLGFRVTLAPLPEAS